MQREGSWLPSSQRLFFSKLECSFLSLSGCTLFWGWDKALLIFGEKVSLLKSPTTTRKGVGRRVISLVVGLEVVEREFLPNPASADDRPMVRLDLKAVARVFYEDGSRIVSVRSLRSSITTIRSVWESSSAKDEVSA